MIVILTITERFGSRLHTKSYRGTQGLSQILSFLYIRKGSRSEFQYRGGSDSVGVPRLLRRVSLPCHHSSLAHEDVDLDTPFQNAYACYRAILSRVLCLRQNSLLPLRIGAVFSLLTGASEPIITRVSPAAQLRTELSGQNALN
jgi:hypothetical protein